MNYFDYQPKGNMGNIWNLFSALANANDSADSGVNSFPYAHTTEIINAALNKDTAALADGTNTFNLKAYEIRCQQNDAINQKQNVKNELFIVENTSDEDHEVGFGDVSDRKIKTVDAYFTEMERRDSFESNIKKLCQIRKIYISEKGVDLVSIIFNSLKGIPESVKELSSLLENDISLKDLVVSLCEDERVGDSLMDQLEVLL